MTIIDHNNPEQQDSRESQNTQGAQAAAGRRPPLTAEWSFHQPGIIDNPVSAGVGGEYFTKMRGALIEIFKDIAPGLEVNVVSLNRQNLTSLKFSALVVTVRHPTIAPNAVAFYTLILEATGEKLQPVYTSIDNQQVAIRRVTSDALDDILSKIAFDEVSKMFPNSHVYSADAMVIPARVTTEQKTVIENIARNAAMACVSVISIATESNGKLDLTQMDRDCRFVIDVAFGNHQVSDCVGEPVRSSVLIGYSSQKKTAQSIGGGGYGTVNVPENVARICDLSGFLNTIWAPVEQNDSLGFARQNPNIQRRTEKFAAEFVVTNVKTEFATSPAAIIFALTSFLALVDNNTWIQALLPKPNSHTKDAIGNKVDITDIGALNITANIAGEVDKGGFGTPIDMAALKGDILEINKYLVSIYSPGVIISLDCPEAGPSSWYLSVFAAAASGDVVAYNQIYDAIMELTGGKFEKYFKPGTPMFTNVIRVPLGHYALGDTMQDIRNIDYTAISNLFANNPSAIHEYSNTFVDRPGVSAERNLNTREGLILHALNEQAEITGYAARVSFADDCISAVSQAIAECKLPVTVNTPLNADQLRSSVAAPSFVQGSLARDTHTYSSGFGGPARAQGYRYSGYRR